MEAQVARMKLLEERSETIEARLAEAHQRHVDTTERLTQRHEKVSSHLETVKLHGGVQVHNVETLAKKIQEMEATISESDRHLRDTNAFERRQRQEEIASVRQAMISEQERLRATIDGKIQASLGNESMARQEMGQNILESVHSAMGQKPKANDPFVQRITDITSIMSDEGRSEVIHLQAARAHVGDGSLTLPGPGAFVVGSAKNLTQVPGMAQVPFAAKPGQAPMMQGGRGSLVHQGMMASPQPASGQYPVRGGAFSAPNSSSLAPPTGPLPHALHQLPMGATLLPFAASHPQVLSRPPSVSYQGQGQTRVQSPLMRRPSAF